MKKTLLATVISIGMASSAFAVTAQSGFYVGALGGWSSSGSPSASAVGASSESNRNYTWGGILGYDYAFNQNLLAGLEISYIDFGQNDYNNVTTSNGLQNFNISSTGVQIMATGTYLANNGFNAFVKAGGIEERTAQSNNIAIDLNGDTSTRDFLPAAAVGIGYMFTQNLNLALQYEHVFGSDWDHSTYQSTSKPSPLSQNAITLGLTYKFGL